MILNIKIYLLQIITKNINFLHNSTKFFKFLQKIIFLVENLLLIITENYKKVIKKKVANTQNNSPDH